MRSVFIALVSSVLGLAGAAAFLHLCLNSSGSPGRVPPHPHLAPLWLQFEGCFPFLPAPEGLILPCVFPELCSHLCKSSMKLSSDTPSVFSLSCWEPEPVHIAQCIFLGDTVTLC